MHKNKYLSLLIYITKSPISVIIVITGGFMKLQLRNIGNSLGVILPKEKLASLGKTKGDLIDLEILESPEWDKIKEYTAEERRMFNEQDFAKDDLEEWKNL